MTVRLSAPMLATNSDGYFGCCSGCARGTQRSERPQRQERRQARAREKRAVAREIIDMLDNSRPITRHETGTDCLTCEDLPEMAGDDCLDPGHNQRPWMFERCDVIGRACPDECAMTGTYC